MRRINPMLALVALGCASPVPASPELSMENKVWARADAAYVAPGDYEQAATACRGPRDGGLPEVSAGPEAARDFVRCMDGRGWILVDAP